MQTPVPDGNVAHATCGARRNAGARSGTQTRGTPCRAPRQPTIIRAVPVQPTGTVTLLFSDIEGSTRLLERLGPASYADALATHREILRSAFLAHDGYEVDTAGDSFFVAFARAADAVAAAGDAQLGLASATWPDGMAMRVRMGVHTGEPVAVASGYVGIDVHRAARIMAAAHGGQVVVSGTTHALLDGSTATQLRDLGPHRLKDLLAPSRSTSSSSTVSRPSFRHSVPCTGRISPSRHGRCWAGNGSSPSSGGS